MECQELENGLYLFKFKNEEDMKIVEDIGSWCFKGQLLVYRRWEPCKFYELKSVRGKMKGNRGF